MNLLHRIVQRIRGHRYEARVVIDPKKLAVKKNGCRIVLFGSRCVVLHAKERKL